MESYSCSPHLPPPDPVISDSESLYLSPWNDGIHYIGESGSGDSRSGAGSWDSGGGLWAAIEKQQRVSRDEMPMETKAIVLERRARMDGRTYMHARRQSRQSNDCQNISTGERQIIFQQVTSDPVIDKPKLSRTGARTSHEDSR